MKAVILAAGFGTRLIPYSKEMPKEMLPIFSVENGEPLLKPILQMVFEQLYEAGVRDFCFVVGRGKRAIEDHFTPDWSYVDYLEMQGKESLSRLLRSFYEKIESSNITWVNQPFPKGTGDATLKARGFVGGDPFILAAGDNLFLGGNVASELIRIHRSRGAAAMAGKRVEDPQRYGVIVGRRVADNIYVLERLIEKPREPPSNLVNTSLYLLPPEVFEALERCELSPRGELEITDAIQMLVEGGWEVYVYDVGEMAWVDVGTPQTYLNALLLSLKNCSSRDIVSKVVGVLGDWLV